MKRREKGLPGTRETEGGPRGPQARLPGCWTEGRCLKWEEAAEGPTPGWKEAAVGGSPGPAEGAAGPRSGQSEAAVGAMPGWEEGAGGQRLLQADHRERHVEAPLWLGRKVTPRPSGKRLGAG